jgi:hypothetical protein
MNTIEIDSLKNWVTMIKQLKADRAEIDEQIDDEIEKGILPDPNAPVDEMGNPIPEGNGEALPPEGTGDPALGEVPEEPVAPEPPPEPKGGKI